jgi:uncharacterized membrane protein
MPRRLPAKDPLVNEGKVFAILGYLSILCIVPLIFKKDNPFVLSHSKQGLVLFVGQVGLFILSIIFPWCLKVGIFILSVLSFWGIIAVLQGRYLSLPLVARIARKITL